MLRWILLAVGVVIFIGIYLFARRSNRKERELEFDFEAPGELPAAEEDTELGSPLSKATVRAELENLEQELDQLSEIIAADVNKSAATPAPTQAKPARPAQLEIPVTKTRERPSIPAEEKIVTFYLIADEEHIFTGPDIDRALRGAGLAHGEMSIYHKTMKGNPAAVFSVANIVEPGTFDLAQLDDFTSRGLTLFMQLPGPVDGLAAFDAMLAAARHIAEQLQGELRDRQRNPLSKQMIEHLREDIQEYQRRQQLPPVSA